ncbi:MAG: autotransporter assembly complex protein TamA [Caulobacteraceae bacterium]
MRLPGWAIAAYSAPAFFLAALPSFAAEANAVIQGELDRGLRSQIERAIGESKSRPESRFDARRRARQAAADAIALLRSEGYYLCLVEPDVGLDEPPRAVIKVTPGPRFSLGAARIDWIGASPNAEADGAAEKAVALHPGAPGRAADVVAAEGRIVATLEKLGYADAAARPREVIVDDAARTVSARFRIAAGEQVRLDGVRILTKGNTRPALVRGLMPWKSGALYDPAKLAELERRLRDTGVFDSITVALAPESEAVRGLRPVVVSLVDRPRHTIELGAGYSSSEGSGVEASLIRYNIAGRADTLSFAGKLYDIQQKLDVELDLPHWRRANQTLKLGADVLGDRTPAYDDLGGGVRLGVNRRFTRTSYATLGAALDYATTREKTAVNLLATPVGENLKLLIAAGQAGFALDRSNDPLDPTKGWRVQAQAEPTLITGDRDLAYLKTQTQASAYLPLQADAATVLAARVKLGAIFGGRIPDVPADRRFFAGGGGSVRGFGYQEVGPRLSDNTPEGGLSLVETSVEMRQRLTDRFGLVAFVDAGSVGMGSTPTFTDFSAGAGLGLRYNLGFAPFRIDIATPLDPRKGDSPVQVYLSIGQSF